MKDFDPNSVSEFDSNYIASIMRPNTNETMQPGHIRIARLLVYEGPEEAVREQIRRSIPDGRHLLPNNLILTIHHQGEVLLVGKIIANEVKVYDHIENLKM